MGLKAFILDSTLNCTVMDDYVCSARWQHKCTSHAFQRAAEPALQQSTYAHVFHVNKLALHSHIQSAEAIEWKSSSVTERKWRSQISPGYIFFFPPNILTVKFLQRYFHGDALTCIWGDLVSSFRKRLSRLSLRSCLSEWGKKKKKRKRSQHRNTDNFWWFLISTEMHYSAQPYRK